MPSTGDTHAAEVLFYRLNAIGAQIDRALAGLGYSVTSDVSHTSALVQYVRTPVPGGEVRLWSHPRGAWVLGAPRPGLVGPPAALTAWSAGLNDDEIARVATEHAVACLADRALESPIRWGQVRATRATDLADTLLDLGVPATLVRLTRPLEIDAADWRTLRTNKRPGILILQGNAGKAVIEVGLRPLVGWTADYADFDPGSRGRLNLRKVLLALDDGCPDVPDGQVMLNELAAVLAFNVDIELDDQAGCGEPRQLPVPPEYERTLRRISPTPRLGSRRWEFESHGREYLAQWAERWLRWCGFTQAQAVVAGGRSKIEDPWLEVTLHAGNGHVDLGVVQRTHAKATVAGRRGVVVSRTPASRQAIAWSERAGVLLFQADGHEPKAQNSSAAAYLPAIDSLPMLCADPSCRDFGCQGDNIMLCPNETGRSWEQLT